MSKFCKELIHATLSGHNDRLIITLPLSPFRRNKKVKGLKMRLAHGNFGAAGTVRIEIESLKNL